MYKQYFRRKYKVNMPVNWPIVVVDILKPSC